jgi:hypothetical protein
MAGTTGLEPAASAVTGQRSNQLNYVPSLPFIGLAPKPACLLSILTVQRSRLLPLVPPNRASFRGEIDSKPPAQKPTAGGRNRASVHAL